VIDHAGEEAEESDYHRQHRKDKQDFPARDLSVGEAAYQGNFLVKLERKINNTSYG
jgi:hypothetical protein